MEKAADGRSLARSIPRRHSWQAPWPDPLVRMQKLDREKIKQTPFFYRAASCKRVFHVLYVPWKGFGAWLDCHGPRWMQDTSRSTGVSGRVVVIRGPHLFSIRATMHGARNAVTNSPLCETGHTEKDKGRTPQNANNNKQCKAAFSHC